MAIQIIKLALPAHGALRVGFRSVHLPVAAGPHINRFNGAAEIGPARQQPQGKGGLPSRNRCRYRADNAIYITGGLRTQDRTITKIVFQPPDQPYSTDELHQLLPLKPGSRFREPEIQDAIQNCSPPDVSWTLLSMQPNPVMASF